MIKVMKKSALVSYCDSADCQSTIKIINNEEDIKKDHDHPQKLRTFVDLRKELSQESHPLIKAKESTTNDDIFTMIDQEIDNLMKAFAVVAIDLKLQIKNFVTSNVVLLQPLLELFDAVIDKNDAKVLELQHLIPRLSITSQDIVNQEARSELVREKLVLVFKELSNEIEALKKIDISIKNPDVEYTWSTLYKHAGTKINGAQVSSQAGVWNMNLIKPSFSMTEVTKVRLEVSQLYGLLVSLCDVNIAKDRNPTWDYCLNPRDGTYSHHHGGGIYPHHLEPKQLNEEVLAFAFEEGDILELEWNGPMRQFTTSRPLTLDKYVQNVQFNEGAFLHFGVQMQYSAVDILP